MDPIGSIKIAKDSTFAMLLAAARRGWDLFYMELGDLCLLDGMAQGVMRPLTVQDDPKGWFTLGEPERRPLHALDAVLMRKDPPFDMEYVYGTYLLELAAAAGCLVVNDPRTLRDANEKVFAAQFPDCVPPLSVTRSGALLREFIATHGDAVLKPLDGMGGRSIFRVRAGDPNTGVIIETLTDHGRRFCMAQRFIPEISAGDRRVLLVDGEPAPYVLARIPSPDDARGNLAAGAFNEDDEAFAAPPSVLPILRLSQVLAAKSDDLFNPAIGHLVRAWGLQSQDPSRHQSGNSRCVRPVDDELVALVVDARPRMSDIAIDDIRIASRNHLVRLDFRDISQGLAIDRMIGRLKELGIDNASVSIDGKLRAIGSRDGHPWTVTVRGPGGGGVLATLNILGNEAAATVGGQRYLISYQGSTYPDVIDPRTGRPAEHTTSVTVLHENASTADAAATALFVAGPREWHRVAMQMGVRYVMLSDSEGRLHMNPEMQARVKLQGSKREVIVSEPLT
jgi:glutathione synthase